MYPDDESKSQQLYRRALQVLPGGNSRHTVFYAPYPVYAASGRGCRITDVDGVERLDFVCNYSADMHGHSHPEIVAAIQAQAAKVISVGMPTAAEIDLAERICARMPGIDRIRFCNSGTEAVMFALKAARGFSGKPAVAKVEGAYHGSDDGASTSQQPDPARWGDAGAPSSVPQCGASRGAADDMVIIPMNDAGAACAIIEKHRDQLAAVLLDPIVKQLGYEQATPAFLRAIREVTQKHGILLIFDEVYSFRLGYRGAQGATGVTPDITAMGKIIGGGLPVGAVGGRADIMEAVFDPRDGGARVGHGGTFNANPLTMAAGAAAMALLTQSEFDRVAALGERARAGLREAAKIAAVPAMVRGATSMVGLFHLEAGTEMHNYRDMAAVVAGHPEMLQRAYRFFLHMLNNGVLMSPMGFMLLSTAMTESDIDFMLEQALQGMRSLG